MLFMTNKITKKEFFGMLEMVVESSNVANKEELKAFVKREIELLNKKAESRKAGTTKKAKENMYNRISLLAQKYCPQQYIYWLTRLCCHCKTVDL